MADYNYVSLMGRLTRDPETIMTANNTAITKFGLAVNDRQKVDGEWLDVASFFDVVTFGRTAEVAAEYLSKGSTTMVAGRLKQDTWEQDGQPRQKVVINVDRLTLVSSGKQQAQQPVKERAAVTVPDDTPF